MKKIFLPLLALFMLVSCNNDDDATSADVMTFSLLRDYYAPEQGASNFYTPNQILWTFDFTNMTITIETQQGIDSPVLPAGSYSYTLVDGQCDYGDNLTVQIDTRQYGALILDELSSGKISLSQECYDGNLLFFEN
ncbi:hypothetical protein [uncultured Kordia sp.]|uniref:hypothetical protein n=1 Tax=uncultured Kordia sp. TaxID=507699 RepID=UPI0026226848|nr:hypothetical protein [uncultured Kordia sp.]